MKFSEKIVKLRKMKGLTQDEFASAVGVSRQAVYKWESGQSYPEVAKLLEMKMLFNISIDDLLDENYEVIVPEKPKRKREIKAEKKPTASAPAAKIDEVKEEPVLVSEPTVKEEPVAVSEPTNEPVTESEAVAEKDEKRRGFFSRIFGKK